jgi:cytochrome c oxidase assembly protein subunit 15
MRMLVVWGKPLEICAIYNDNLDRMYKRIITFTILLTFLVISFGAYVRLSDAGLGCPDWPGCYGKLVGVPDTHHEITQLESATPGTEVHPGKAWKEMIHRYLAGTLGLLIAALAWLSFFPQRRRNAWAHLALVGLVGIQATLGMLTVTWLLKPAIVTLHLLGGMLILATLIGIRANRHPNPSTRNYPTGLRLAAWLVVGLVLTQIALGGWTSSNYAAMACVDYPLCRGELIPSSMDWQHAYVVNRALGQTADGQGITLDTLITIHWTHRWFAVVVVLACLAFAWRVIRQDKQIAPWGIAMLLAVLTQFTLGISNVLLQWPLSLAVLHNFVAAVLLAVAVHLAITIGRGKQNHFLG